MIVNVLKPQGFCQGVATALKKVFDAIDNPNTPRPIYLLGRIIHNDIVVNKIKETGVIVLDDPKKSKLDQLKEIESGTVIFSAHGVPPIYYQIAKDKQLFIIDATCKNVLKIHERIKDALNNNYNIIYVGTPNHPEANAVLGISDRISFITSISDIDKLNFQTDNIYATNQTTLSHYDIKEIKDTLINKFPSIIFDDKICGATSVRQKAMAKQPKADLCIVVGDRFSSNTNKLVSVSQNIANIKTILVSSVHELTKDMFDNVNICNVSSGASTPKEITDEVISYLHQL